MSDEMIITPQPNIEGHFESSEHDGVNPTLTEQYSSDGCVVDIGEAGHLAERAVADGDGQLASDAFDKARRVLATTLPCLPPDRHTWFTPLSTDARVADKAADVAHELLQGAAHLDLDVVVATKRGALPGAALQGWAWDLNDATAGRARTAGAEQWPAICRYQRPAHAATVVLAALVISPDIAVDLLPVDVTSDGQFVLAQSDTPIAVVAPPARRALAAQASAAIGGSFLSIYGRPMSVSVATDIVRRSVGVLGMDLVTNNGESRSLVPPFSSVGGSA